MTEPKSKMAAKMADAKFKMAANMADLRNLTLVVLAPPSDQKVSSKMAAKMAAKMADISSNPLLSLTLTVRVSGYKIIAFTTLTDCKCWRNDKLCSLNPNSVFFTEFSKNAPRRRVCGFFYQKLFRMLKNIKKWSCPPKWLEFGIVTQIQNGGFWKDKERCWTALLMQTTGFRAIENITFLSF